MNMLKKRSRGYTSVSVLITVLVLALVMLLNTVFSVLAAHYSLFVDLTNTELWTLSDEAKKVIAEADGDITITFCHEKDYIESSSTMKYISGTAEEIAKAFPNIHVRYLNSILEPKLFEKYKYTDVSTIKTTSVIVESGSEFRVYAADAFFVTDTNTNNVWAYNGEEIFAAAFLAVTAAETPLACFTTGHGESVDAAFINTIVKAGYEARTIDLTKEDIPDDCRLIIVNDPRYDLAGYNIYDKDAVSEIAKIDKFLDSNGTLMVFKDPDTAYLKNLEEYLYEWGVVFSDGVVVDNSDSITSDGQSLVATYPSGTLASSIHKDISSLSSPPKTIVKYASPITVSDLFTAGRDADGVKTNTWTYSGNTAYRELSAVLTAGKTAEVVEDGQVIDRTGGYNLMTVTREMNTVAGDTYYGYVLAAGTRFFTSPDYLESNVYANENILYYALRVMGREKIPADIPFKEFANTKIEDMTSAEATRAAILLITVIPLITAAAGIVVTTRRKYK